MKYRFIFLAVLLGHSVFSQSIEVQYNKIKIGPDLNMSWLASSKDVRISPATLSTSPFGLSFNSATGQNYGGIRYTPNYSLLWSPTEIQFSTGNLDNNNQMTLSSEGNLGIQNSTPSFALDLRSPNDTVASFVSSGFFSSSYLKVGNNALLGSNNMVSSSSGLLSGARIRGSQSVMLQAAQRVDMLVGNRLTLMATEDNVTINPGVVGGIFGVPLSYVEGIADLDVNNTIRSAELDFVENDPTDKRPVFADKDGILRLGNSIGYKTVSHLSAICQGDCDNFTKTSSIFYFTQDPSSYKIYVPVELPDSVRVNEMTLYYYDNSTTSNISVKLLSEELTSSAPIPRFSYTTTGSSLTYLRESTTTINGFITNNRTHRYWLEIESTNDIWDGINQRMGSVRFKYEII